MHFAGPCSDCWNDVVLILGSRGSGLPTYGCSFDLIGLYMMLTCRLSYSVRVHDGVCPRMHTYARMQTHACCTKRLLAQPFEQLFCFML